MVTSLLKIIMCRNHNANKNRWSWLVIMEVTKNTVNNLYNKMFFLTPKCSGMETARDFYFCHGLGFVYDQQGF
jgi:hypothetical protein